MESQPDADMFSRGLLDFPRRPIMTTGFVIGIVLSIATNGAGFQERAVTPRIIRVFVKTDDVTDRDQITGRKTSVKDLADAFGTKKKTLSVVNEEAGADIVIDVIDRAIAVPKVVLGIGSRPGDPPGGTAPLRNAVLRVRLTAGDAAADFQSKNRAADNPRGWKSAADNLADQIDKWVADQRGRIIR